ncbi:site-specific integrase [Paraburkholderia sacchari]|uniref:site-specific integrase n=1 Tax=Paraburkholderia sacchari TaxID=159450 RepID=UPI0005424F00|nr:site-specific integrase [Paraburkholderia sacchari]NLP64362.1 site-specific integrase [Paraburkholderia sacchari]
MSKALISRDLLRTLTPNGKIQEIADTALTGFVARMMPTGAIQFGIRFRDVTGKSIRRKIGTYPAMQPSAAREAARKELEETPVKHDTAAVIEQKKRHAETVRAAHGVPTLGEFLERDYRGYLTANNISEANADLIASSFADLMDRPLDDLTSWTLEQWKSRAAKTGIKPKTIANKLHALQGLPRVATDAKHIADNPAKKVKRNGKADVVVRYLSADERARLYAAMEAREESLRDARHRTNAHRRARPNGALKPLPSLRDTRFCDHLQPLVICALNSGLRKGELLALEWSNVDFEMRSIHVRRGVTKDDERRDVPVTDELFECFTAWRPLAQKVYVFGNPETDAPLTDFGNAWDALLEAAEITGFRFHDCRHDYASKLVAAGIDLNRVRALLGHSDIKTVLRYAHLAPDHLHAAIDTAFNAPRRAAPRRRRVARWSHDRREAQASDAQDAVSENRGASWIR